MSYWPYGGLLAYWLAPTATLCFQLALSATLCFQALIFPSAPRSQFNGFRKLATVTKSIKSQSIKAINVTSAVSTLRVSVPSGPTLHMKLN